jgi:ketosteroid isomerase-like protein
MAPMIRPIRLAFAMLLFTAGPAVAEASSVQAGVDGLLAADRAFSAAAAQAADAVSGFAPMLDADVVMPSPGRGHLVGREAVVGAFRDGPAFREGRVEWTPVRAGISADGTQGFTFGYLTLSGGDPARRNRKYLAYWVRRPEGWRVAAYRQNVREAGEVSLDLLPPSLPRFATEPIADPEAIADHQRSLAAAEQAFSDRAQRAGLRTAFREYGRPDAMNMYEGAAFRVGLDAVTAGFPEGQTTSPVRWSTERSLVASSGDLGVSIGTIRPNGPVAEGRPSSLPFFTIWRRDAPDSPWRYIAE